ncbi:NAD(P)-binding protein [Violaceomyces palustris]|uniref:NAD(P)-binding protein n=1 Tax=Violaceomyces palustris TaxID=1673888 RepID=A0ACD0P6E5_9BASI|nr:NAD(P)-binding protein [Violaceomyces palustris]
MVTVTNKQVIFKQVMPTGLPKKDVTTQLGSVELDIDNVDLAGGVLTRNIACSLDPTMRNRMKGNINYFSPPYQVGKPVTAIGLAEIYRSEMEEFKKGDIVAVWDLAIEEWSVRSKESTVTFRKFDPLPGLSITTYLGAAGMTGMTAYMSIKEIIGDLKPGNTMFVTGAAGAVGQMVVQIARQAGVKVIASAGSDQKVKYLEQELGVERAFNYKTADFNKELAAFGAQTNGINYYYDNVGGEQLEAYINNAARYGVIVGCGYISGYNAEKPEDVHYPKNLFNIVTKELKYQGFIVSSFLPKWMARFLQEIPPMLAEGKIKVSEDVTFGIDGAEDAFTRLFTGETEGKVTVLFDTERAEHFNVKPRKGGNL